MPPKRKTPSESSKEEKKNKELSNGQKELQSNEMATVTTTTTTTTTTSSTTANNSNNSTSNSTENNNNDESSSNANEANGTDGKPTSEKSEGKREKKKDKSKRDSKKKARGTASPAKKPRTHSSATASDDDDDDESNSDSDNDDEGPLITVTNEDGDPFAGWTCDQIVSHWILNPPRKSDTFPDPPKGAQFLGSHYGSGKWRWRDVGTRDWNLYDDLTSATIEYNYRRGVRQFKMTEEGTEYEISLDHRSQRETKDHTKRWVIERV